MPMALHSEGPSAAQHGARLLHLVELRRHVAIAFITRSTSNAASRRNARQAPPLASSIAKASRAPKKGGPHRSARLRCRQADQGQEAPHSRRYAGSVAACASVTSADIQDRDGGIMLLATLFGQFPFLAKLFADSAYKGRCSTTALAKIMPCLETEIVKRLRSGKGLRRCPSVGSSNAPSVGSTAVAASPRTGKISTATPSHSLQLASIRLMLRKLCNPS